MNEAIGFLQQNGLNTVLWLLAALGLYNLIGKNLGHILFGGVHQLFTSSINAIPSKEIQANAKALCQQADAWVSSADGKAKFDWALAALCKMYPIVASVATPILQNAYNEYKAEVQANQPKIIEVKG